MTYYNKIIKFIAIFSLTVLIYSNCFNVETARIVVKDNDVCLYYGDGSVQKLVKNSGENGIYVYPKLCFYPNFITRADSKIKNIRISYKYDKRFDPGTPYEDSPSTMKIINSLSFLKLSRSSRHGYFDTKYSSSSHWSEGNSGNVFSYNGSTRRYDDLSIRCDLLDSDMYVAIIDTTLDRGYKNDSFYLNFGRTDGSPIFSLRNVDGNRIYSKLIAIENLEDRISNDIDKYYITSLSTDNSFLIMMPIYISNQTIANSLEHSITIALTLEYDDGQTASFEQLIKFGENIIDVESKDMILITESTGEDYEFAISEGQNIGAFKLYKSIYNGIDIYALNNESTSKKIYAFDLGDDISAEELSKYFVEVAEKNRDGSRRQLTNGNIRFEPIENSKVTFKLYDVNLYKRGQANSKFLIKHANIYAYIIKSSYVVAPIMDFYAAKYFKKGTNYYGINPKMVARYTDVAKDGAKELQVMIGEAEGYTPGVLDLINTSINYRLTIPNIENSDRDLAVFFEPNIERSQAGSDFIVRNKILKNQVKDSDLADDDINYYNVFKSSDLVMQVKKNNIFFNEPSAAVIYESDDMPYSGNLEAKKRKIIVSGFSVRADEGDGEAIRDFKGENEKIEFIHIPTKIKLNIAGMSDIEFEYPITYEVRNSYMVCYKPKKSINLHFSIEKNNVEDYAVIPFPIATKIEKNGDKYNFLGYQSLLRSGYTALKADKDDLFNFAAVSSKPFNLKLSMTISEPIIKHTVEFPDDSILLLNSDKRKDGSKEEDLVLYLSKGIGTDTLEFKENIYQHSIYTVYAADEVASDKSALDFIYKLEDPVKITVNKLFNNPVNNIVIKGESGNIDFLELKHEDADDAWNLRYSKPDQLNFLNLKKALKAKEAAAKTEKLVSCFSMEAERAFLPSVKVATPGQHAEAGAAQQNSGLYSITFGRQGVKSSEIWCHPKCYSTKQDKAKVAMPAPAAEAVTEAVELKEMHRTDLKYSINRIYVQLNDLYLTDIEKRDVDGLETPPTEAFGHEFIMDGIVLDSPQFCMFQKSQGDLDALINIYTAATALAVEDAVEQHKKEVEIDKKAGKIAAVTKDVEKKKYANIVTELLDKNRFVIGKDGKKTVEVSTFFLLHKYNFALQTENSKVGNVDVFEDPLADRFGTFNPHAFNIPFSVKMARHWNFIFGKNRMKGIFSSPDQIKKEQTDRVFAYKANGDLTEFIAGAAAPAADAAKYYIVMEDSKDTVRINKTAPMKYKLALKLNYKGSAIDRDSAAPKVDSGIFDLNTYHNSVIQEEGLKPFLDDIAPKDQKIGYLKRADYGNLQVVISTFNDKTGSKRVEILEKFVGKADEFKRKYKMADKRTTKDSDLLMERQFREALKETTAKYQEAKKNHEIALDGLNDIEKTLAGKIKDYTSKFNEAENQLDIKGVYGDVAVNLSNFRCFTTVDYIEQLPCDLLQTIFNKKKIQFINKLSEIKAAIGNAEDNLKAAYDIVISDEKQKEHIEAVLSWSDALIYFCNQKCDQTHGIVFCKFDDIITRYEDLKIKLEGFLKNTNILIEGANKWIEYLKKEGERLNRRIDEVSREVRKGSENRPFLAFFTGFISTVVRTSDLYADIIERDSLMEARSVNEKKLEKFNKIHGLFINAKQIAETKKRDIDYLAAEAKRLKTDSSSFSASLVQIKSSLAGLFDQYLTKKREEGAKKKEHDEKKAIVGDHAAMHKLASEGAKEIKKIEEANKAFIEESKKELQQAPMFKELFSNVVDYENRLQKVVNSIGEAVTLAEYKKLTEELKKIEEDKAKVIAKIKEGITRLSTEKVFKDLIIKPIDAKSEKVEMAKEDKKIPQFSGLFSKMFRPFVSKDEDKKGADIVEQKQDEVIFCNKVWDGNDRLVSNAANLETFGRGTDMHYIAQDNYLLMVPAGYRSFTSSVIEDKFEILIIPLDEKDKELPITESADGIVNLAAPSTAASVDKNEYSLTKESKEAGIELVSKRIPNGENRVVLRKKEPVYIFPKFDIKIEHPNRVALKNKFDIDVRMLYRIDEIKHSAEVIVKDKIYDTFKFSNVENREYKALKNEISILQTDEQIKRKKLTVDEKLNGHFNVAPILSLDKIEIILKNKKSASERLLLKLDSVFLKSALEFEKFEKRDNNGPILKEFLGACITEKTNSGVKLRLDYSHTELEKFRIDELFILTRDGKPFEIYLKGLSIDTELFNSLIVDNCLIVKVYGKAELNDNAIKNKQYVIASKLEKKKFDQEPKEKANPEEAHILAMSREIDIVIEKIEKNKG